MADPAFDDFIQQMSAGEGLSSGDASNIDQLLSQLDNMEGLSDEEKIKMKTEMLMEALKSIGQGAIKSPIGSKSYTVFFVMVSIVVAVFGT